MSLTAPLKEFRYAKPLRCNVRVTAELFAGNSRVGFCGPWRRAFHPRARFLCRRSRLLFPVIVDKKVFPQIMQDAACRRQLESGFSSLEPGLLVGVIFARLYQGSDLVRHRDHLPLSQAAIVSTTAPSTLACLLYSSGDGLPSPGMNRWFSPGNDFNVALLATPRASFHNPKSFMVT